MTRLSEWELAGLYSDRGALGRPLAGNVIVCPTDISLDKPSLVWFSGRMKVVPLKPRVLDDFVALTSGEFTADAVLAFAKRWGVLRICERHHFPSVHHEHCHPELIGRGRFRESVGWWLLLSYTARHILNAAASLHAGKLIQEEDRRWLERSQLKLIPEDKPALIAVDRDRLNLRQRDWNFVTAIVNKWIKLAWVRPQLRVRSGRCLLEFSNIQQRFGGGLELFGALGVQLLFTVSRAEGMAVCSACSTPYIPKRQPSTGRRNYCGTCGLRAAWRDAQAAKRAKRTSRVDES